MKRYIPFWFTMIFGLMGLQGILPHWCLNVMPFLSISSIAVPVYFELKED